ncbi:MAG: hypothetical protein V1865_00735 [bacterium]
MKNECCPNKQIILIGTILILLAAIIAQYVLLSAYFNNRLVRIQNVGASNYDRLQQVGSFVNGLAKQIQPTEPVVEEELEEE